MIAPRVGLFLQPISFRRRLLLSIYYIATLRVAACYRFMICRDMSRATGAATLIC